MYIVKTANGATSICATLEEANEKYFELCNYCPFVTLYKRNEDGTLEEIRCSE